MFIQQFFLGLLLIVIGTAIIRYHRNIGRLFGQSYALERYFGAGSTLTLVKFVGILLILLGFLSISGLLNSLLEVLSRPFVRLFQ